MSGYRPWRDLATEFRAERERRRGAAGQLGWADEVRTLEELGELDARARASRRAERVARDGHPPTTAAHDHAYVPALDAANPVFDRDRLLGVVWTGRWRAVPDDLVGGWAVVTDCPLVGALSDLDLAAGERAVCDGVLSRGLAAHVAALHNAALDALPPDETLDRDGEEEHR